MNIKNIFLKYINKKYKFKYKRLLKIKIYIQTEKIKKFKEKKGKLNKVLKKIDKLKKLNKKNKII